MILDCHGHFTTVPAAHTEWRERQLETFESGVAAPPYPEVSDDAIREGIQAGQLRMMDERGVDMTLFSPRASAMGHHLGDASVSAEWTRHCNDLVHRVATLFPGRFAAVCQLPQSPTGSIDACIDELRRCVDELGFVGCNLNPDPSGGHFSAPALPDRFWYPLYEAMIELDVPAMVHVSASAIPSMHATGAFYLNSDTTAFMQLLQGGLFRDLPDLRLVLPHGGGAVPYHWGRFRGLADMLGQPPIETNVMSNLWFDTCVYHQAGINLLLDVIPSANILFGSEMIGAVRGVDPHTGQHFDDTRRYVDAAPIDDDQRRQIYESNARRVYPRLA